MDNVVNHYVKTEMDYGKIPGVSEEVYHALMIYEELEGLKVRIRDLNQVEKGKG